MRIKKLLLSLLNERPLPAILLVGKDSKARWWVLKLLKSSDYYISMGTTQGVFRK